MIEIKCSHILDTKLVLKNKSIQLEIALGANCPRYNINSTLHCFQTLDEMIEKAVPQNIRLTRDLDLEECYGKNFNPQSFYVIPIV